MILDRLGGYLPPGSLGPSDLTSLFASIIKANGCPLFDIYLDNDVNNTTRPSIVIDLPRYVMVRSFLTDPRPYEVHFL